MAENLRKLVSIFVDQIQLAEDELLRMRTERTIDAATGAQLNIIGEIAGIGRTSTDDEEYRADIKFQLYLNRSSGEPETVINAVKQFTDATFVRLFEVFPASVVVFTDGTTVPYSTLLEKVQSVLAAGVGDVSIIASNGLTAFSFDDEGGFPKPTGSSFFSESNYIVSGTPVGGQFTEVIQ